jgi:hypothetical protein
MGLALLYTEDDEREHGELTKAWVPQLISLMPQEVQLSQGDIREPIPQLSAPPR